MKRLRDFQAVVIAAGPDSRTTCRVVAVQGEDAVLQPDEPVELSEDWTPATLSFEGATAPVLLAGYVGAGPIPDTLRFAQGDGVRVPQMRASPRLELALEVRVTPASGRGPAIDARTKDLSAGGMLIAAPCASEPGEVLVVEVSLPGRDAALAIEATAVRTWPDRTAVRFSGHCDEIATFVLACRQEVARLAARRAAETARKLSGISLRAA